MGILKYMYNDLKEIYGSDVAIRALCVSGGIALILLSLLLKPQQPIVIINEIQSIEDKSEEC